MDAYSSVYPVMRFLLPGGVERHRKLAELERTQWLSRTELEELQFRKIKSLLKHAFEHVPFYRNYYTREDIHPEDIKSYKDFQAIPFLTKDAINNNLDDLVSPGIQRKCIHVRNRGMTGVLARFFTDKVSSNWSGMIQARCRRWYGVREGQRMALIWGALRDIPDSHWMGHLKALIKRNRYLNAFSISNDSMQMFAEMLIRWQPAIIRAYPSALDIFARY